MYFDYKFKSTYLKIINKTIDYFINSHSILLLFFYFYYFFRKKAENKNKIAEIETLLTNTRHELKSETEKVDFMLFYLYIYIYIYSFNSFGCILFIVFISLSLTDINKLFLFQLR